MSASRTSLYAARQPIFPRRVTGSFRRAKWWIMGATLSVYYVTPWLRWDRGANLPDQAVLVDLADRRFYFFAVEIWPHEFYFVAGLLIMAGLGLFLFTAALGRVWCGYACPQTVWTDLFLAVERWVEGDRNARIRLHAAPWTMTKLRLRLTKWAIWLAIALATGGAWVFYFADAPTLLRDLLALRASPAAWASIAILTATTFVFGGFLREQVCIYMCPWPRIQGAMMDEHTLTVAYRDWRGEPRGKGLRRRALADGLAGDIRTVGPRAGGRSPVIPMQLRGSEAVRQPPAPASGGAIAAGDCIDCNACVNVCPMGIDIRDGQQMSCITCALCIDACDKVMADVGRPRGLIDYATLEDCEKEANGEPTRSPWKAIFRPRTIAYFLIWGSVGLGMLFALGVRNHVGLSVSPDRNPPFILMSDGSVRNSYTLKLRNMESRPREMEIALEGLPDALMWTDTVGRDDAARTQIKTVPADQVLSVRAYVIAPEGTATQDFSFSVTSRDEQRETATTETRFDTPGGEQ